MKLVIDYIPKKFKPYARGHYQNDEGYWLIFNDSVILDGERHTAHGKTLPELINDIRENAKILK